MSTPADIRLQVMWNRLLSVVEEQARALVRTAFSTSAREAGDISAGVFDLEGPDAGAGRHRHAGPCEFDGAQRRPLHPRVPGRDHEAGRRLHHQRSVEGHRPSLRHRRHLARLPRRQAGGAVLLHHARRRHRRPRPVARRAAGLPRGPVPAAAAADARRRDRRERDAHRARQRARAGAGRGRHPRPDRLQRHRRAAAVRHDDRARHRPRSTSSARTSSRRAAPAWSRPSPSCRAAPGRAICGSTATTRRSTCMPPSRIARRPHRGRLRRHLGLVDLRHQFADVLHRGLHRLRHQVRRGADHSQQCRHARLRSW